MDGARGTVGADQDVAESVVRGQERVLTLTEGNNALIVGEIQLKRIRIAKKISFK